MNDTTVADAIENLVQPAMKDTRDIDNHLLVIECLGLLGMLDKDLFLNYSVIFQAILHETILFDK